MQRSFPFLTATLFMLLISSSVRATTWTVSNNPNKPAQFTSAQAAADSAAFGDTLLISGSSISYGSLTLDKQLHLIGEGCGPSVDNPNFYSIYFSNISETATASGSVLEGLECGYMYLGHNGHSGPLVNVVVKRCKTNQIFFTYGSVQANISNIRFEDSLIDYYVSFSENRWSGNGGGTEGIEFVRCVFNVYPYHLSSVGDCNGHLIMRNCMFLGTNNNIINGSMSEATFENCIFIGGILTVPGMESCVFNHCLSHQIYDGDGALPPAGNTGSGNLSSIDPQFVSYPSTPTQFSWDHDYTLIEGSPAIGAGAQGVEMDLGIGGNLISFDGNLPHTPRGPVVTEINLPVTAVAVGGTLQINVSAESRD